MKRLLAAITLFIFCAGAMGASITNNALVLRPAGWSGAAQYPIVIYHHGSGETAASLLSDPLKSTVVQAITNAGWFIVSHDAHGNNWGNQASLDDYTNLVDWCLESTNLNSTKRIVFFSQSMGGLSGMLTLAYKTNIVGLFGIYPVFNLKNLYDLGTFTADIKTAYGIAGDGSDYAAKTAGHDPVLMSGLTWTGKRFRFYASYEDVVVPRAVNTDLIAAYVLPVTPEDGSYVATGNHGDPSHFLPSDVVAFLERCISGSPPGSSTVWNDSSGHNNGFTESTGVGAIRVANAVNGLPGVLFDARVATRWTTPNLFADERPFTYWVTCLFTNVAGTNAFFSGVGGNYAVRVINSKMNIIQYPFTDIATGTTTLTNNGWYTLAWTYDTNGVAKFYVNGVQDGTATTNVNATGGHTGTYLASQSSVRDWFGGIIYESGKVPRIVPDAEQAYLANYYTVKLATGTRFYQLTGNLDITGNLNVRGMIVSANAPPPNPGTSRAKLDVVNGEIQLDNNKAIRFSAPGGTNEAGWSMMQIYGDGNTNLGLYNNGAIRMSIAPSGNIGIGSSPTKILDVGGHTRVRGGIETAINSDNLVNSYFDTVAGAFKYRTTGYAADSYLSAANGSWNFNVAPSGTIDTVVPFGYGFSLNPLGQFNLYANLYFPTDNTYDIGGPASARPRNLYVASGITCSGSIAIASGGAYYFGANGTMTGGAGDGIFTMYNNAATGFGRLNFGGGTAAFPSLRRTSAAMDVVLADNSGWAGLNSGPHQVTGALTFGIDNSYDIGVAGAKPRDVLVGRNVDVTSGSVTVSGTGGYYLNTRGSLSASADGVFQLANIAGNDFTRLCFGGVTAAKPAIGKSGTAVTAVLADGSAYTPMIADTFVSASALTSLRPADVSGTDVAGTPLVLRGGTSTGSGAAGNVVIQLGTNTTTGSGLNNANLTRAFYSAHPVTLSGGVATTIVRINMPVSSFLGGTFSYSIFAADASNLQTHSGVVSFSASRVAGGAVSPAIAESAQLEVTGASTGTLSDTWTIVDAGSGNVDIKCSATSSLTETFLELRWNMTSVFSTGAITITPQ